MPSADATVDVYCDVFVFGVYLFADWVEKQEDDLGLSHQTRIKDYIPPAFQWIEFFWFVLKQKKKLSPKKHYNLQGHDISFLCVN